MFAKSKIVRIALCACLALPIGCALLQPTEAQAGWFYRYRPIYRPAPIVVTPVVPVTAAVPVAPVTPAPVVNVGTVVPVAPIYRYYGGYRWHWNGYRWIR